MTSSNYIKSVQLLVINLEYICVVIFRGFTEVYQENIFQHSLYQDAIMLSYFGKGQFYFYAFCVTFEVLNSFILPYIPQSQLLLRTNVHLLTMKTHRLQRIELRDRLQSAGSNYPGICFSLLSEAQGKHSSLTAPKEVLFLVIRVQNKTEHAKHSRVPIKHTGIASFTLWMLDASGMH